MYTVQIYFNTLSGLFKEEATVASDSTGVIPLDHSCITKLIYLPIDRTSYKTKRIYLITATMALFPNALHCPPMHFAAHSDSCVNYIITGYSRYLTGSNLE